MEKSRRANRCRASFVRSLPSVHGLCLRAGPTSIASQRSRTKKLDAREERREGTWRGHGAISSKKDRESERQEAASSAPYGAGANGRRESALIAGVAPGERLQTIASFAAASRSLGRASERHDDAVRRTRSASHTLGPARALRFQRRIGRPSWSAPLGALSAHWRYVAPRSPRILIVVLCRARRGAGEFGFFGILCGFARSERASSGGI
ncbi:hypothetical protein Mp_2g21630 [Marchantia polymorpha subsp. ruderalis]|uniref:Uncharacterized protein n=1 Tax=Marchantia polymorpha TaxID=3197 RepID=A0A2R6X2P0_MARPO|nr:hypothetical protein MARPO_0040s0051 [Marchantia polymorpha]BBN03208.1 hypothetical protein Mp_2g21630 [Marchantia polymorpha subsp. ruderalis]|eukprot:PTQ40368.1 hypothetical protein MARPO_0040s0051 [Marchantia polymorpha]